MKNQSPRRVVSPVTYFLSCLFLLLCLLAQPARATIPSGLTLTSANIGTAIGGESYNASTDSFTIMGTGTGFFFGAGMQPDSDHFSYTTAAGDMEIVARLVSFDNPKNGQAGLMIRQSNSPNEVNKAVTFFWSKVNGGDNNIAYEGYGPPVDGNAYYYNSAGGAAKPALNPPYWLKLVRVGSNYGAYWSLDGHDWYVISGDSGGATMGTGTFNIGFFVDNYIQGQTTLSTAVFDNVYIGAPRLKYKTSWIGSTSAGMANGNPSNEILSLWVKPSDGTCYANSNWDESGGQAGKVYRDGKVLHGFFGATGGGQEGCVTGNSSYVYYATDLSNVPTVYRTDFTTNTVNQLTFAAPTLGAVGGIAASATRIFVADTTNGTVRIVDAATLTEITPAIVFPHCGPIAYDGTNFWITQCASPFPLSWHITATAGYTPAIKCYSPAGADLSSTHAPITDVAIPTAVAYDDRGTAGTTADDRLWICDNGSNQNIRYYTNLTGNPTFAGTFGQTGGIWAGSHPGQITDAAAGGDQRFYGPTGVGVDSSGNIFVACDGDTNNVTDLRKFTSTGTLVWRQNGLVFTDVGDFDPASDGQQIYLPERHFTMNYANTAPGSEWSFTGFTCNLPLNGNDTRNRSSSSYGAACGDKLARLGAGNNLYMYTTGQGVVGTSWLYYFNGETAVPFGTNFQDIPAGGIHRLWIDADLNGVKDTKEETSAPNPLPGGALNAFDVDSAGDIWMNFRGQYLLADAGSIRRVVCLGTQQIGGVSGPIVPNYNLSTPGGYIDYQIPSPLGAVVNINYDKINDVLYAVGQKSDGTWMLVRCDKWEANAENKYNPVATWAVNLPPPSDLTMLFPSSTDFTYSGLDVAGGKIFVGEHYGPIHVYDAALGNPEIVLNPGPELSARTGWNDMSMGVNAFKRSTGEYLVTEEDSGWNAAAVLYRWTPQADTAVDAAPMRLTATAPGRVIALSWAGPVGMVTSYKLYRSTSSGMETLYQSGITSPAFTDTNVTPGTTYYYKVTAVNAVGESAQSNEASATPLTSQVEFVKTDLTTKGTWKTVYGNDGYEICNHATSYPAYATVTAPGTSTYSWADPTTDVRGLQKVGATTDRIAAYRSVTPLNNSDGSLNTQPWSWNINFTDGKWHQVAIYLLDWTNNYLYHQVKILDAATGTVLYTRVLSTFTTDFNQGEYLVWNIYGSVKIQISDTQPWNNPIASGLFFDPVQIATPAIAWWKFNETSGTTAADSSGAGHNATLSGATWDPAGPTHLNGCVKIPGGTARVNLPTSLITGHVPITLSAWFKTSSTTGAVIAGYRYTDSDTSPTHWVPVLYVGIDGRLRGSLFEGAATASTLLISTATVNNGAWHHVALVADGTCQTLYLDGNIVDYRACVLSTVALPYNYLGFGSTTGFPSVSSPTNYFNGWLDDVRIYDKALTASQVLQLANP